MTKRYLLLDDVRQPSEITWVWIPQGVNWDIVKNYNEFVEYIQANGIPEFIAFDSDLGLEHYMDPENVDKEAIYKERSGYDALVWLINVCQERSLTFPRHATHTMNPVSRKKMVQALQNFKKHFPHLSENI